MERNSDNVTTKYCLKINKQCFPIIKMPAIIAA